MGPGWVVNSLALIRESLALWSLIRPPLLSDFDSPWARSRSIQPEKNRAPRLWPGQYRPDNSPALIPAPTARAAGPPLPALAAWPGVRYGFASINPFSTITASIN